MHTPLYTSESQSHLAEETSYHTLTVIHQPNASVIGQGGSSEQALSSVLHELRDADK